MKKKSESDQFPVLSKPNTLPSGISARGLDAIIAAVKEKLKDPDELRKNNDFWDQWDEFERWRSVIVTEFYLPMHANVSNTNARRFIRAVQQANIRSQQLRYRKLPLEDLVTQIYELIKDELSQTQG